MGTITAIRASPRHAGRFVIEVDGTDFAIVAHETIDRFGLAVGRSIAAVADAVERDAAALKTYDRALTMLAARPRSSSDLRRRLLRKGDPAEHVDATILRLQRAGFLDDAAFARQFVESKSVGAGMAKRRLERELARRGVERRVVDEAIGEMLVDSDTGELENAERILRKRLRSLGTDNASTRRRRLYAYLARRGYESSTILIALERVLGAADEGALDPSTSAHRSV